MVVALFVVLIVVVAFLVQLRFQEPRAPAPLSFPDQAPPPAAMPPPPFPGQAPPDLSQIVESELRKLVPGRVLFNPPQEMQVGMKERVEVRIAKTLTEDLTVGLKGRGLPREVPISVGEFMKVRLTGIHFDVRPLSDEEQLVAGEEFTQWDWDVTPTKSGIQSLVLMVAVRIKIATYGEEKRDYPVYENQIRVRVNPLYSLENFISENWKLILPSGGVLTLVGWIAKKWRDKKHRPKHSRSKTPHTEDALKSTKNGTNR